MARALLGVLALERVHDVESEEAERFSRIDPADPRVDEICLLTDMLREAIEADLAQASASHLRSGA